MSRVHRQSRQAQELRRKAEARGLTRDPVCDRCGREVAAHNWAFHRAHCPMKGSADPGQISFRVSKDERELVRQIVDRAGTDLRVGQPFDRVSLEMDITAVHANGTPLMLKDLLTADEADFVHDVVGIMRHLNRTTGQLEDCFVPRTAVPEREIPAR